MTDQVVVHNVCKAWKDSYYVQFTLRMGSEKRENKRFRDFIQFSTTPPPARLHYFYNEREKTTENNRLYLSVFLRVKKI